MLTDDTAKQYLADLNRDIAEANACLADAEALSRRMCSLGCLLERRRVDVPSAQDVHRAALLKLIAWFRENVLPGFPIALEATQVFDAMAQPRTRGYHHDLTAITPERLMAFLRRTYGPSAREHARETLHHSLRHALWLKRTREERGTLVLHIGARSETSFGSRDARHIPYSGREQIERALTEVARAVAFDGGALPARPGALAGDALTRALTDEFRYRAKVPVALGHLVLFKEHVDLVLDPALAPAFALFLASAPAELAVA
jgi:hypothetical protein